MATGLGGLTIGFLTNSTRLFRAPVRVRLAALSELPRDGYRRFQVEVTQRSFWERTTRKTAVYARNDPQHGLLALRGDCSHMGCAVRWEEASATFSCPCHEGVFDEAGRALSGPVVDPLERVEASVNQGQVYVSFEPTA